MTNQPRATKLKPKPSKSMYSLSEAAARLSETLGCAPLSEADVLQLALDEQLTLSVEFVNFARGRLGRMRDEGHGKKFLDFPPDQPAEPEVLDGVWDLPMVGGEKIDVKAAHQVATGGPPVTLRAKHGAFVCKSDGRWAQLYAASSLDAGGEAEGWVQASRLPPHSSLVVRAGALESYEKAQGAPAARSVSPGADTKERNSLLLMVGVLTQMLKIDPAEEAASVGRILRGAQQQGVSISENTIRKYLREVSQALGK